MAGNGDFGSPETRRLPPVPGEFVPWWQDALRSPILRESQPLPVTLDDLIIRALNHSAQIKVFSDLPLIRETAIVEADAAFDWHAFMESRWDDISDPVGNTLTVGPGSTRFRDHYWTSRGGLRRQTMHGGEFELSQGLNHQSNNSVYFQPHNQGTARLSLSYTQPLLRGAGRVYNTSLIVLAQIDTDVAREEFSRQLQSHLLEVTRSYWGLYLERGNLLQQRRSYQRAREILEELQARQSVDATKSQMVRVEAAVTERQAGLIRSEYAVRNAEERIQALVNDEQLAFTSHLELVPQDCAGPRRNRDAAAGCLGNRVPSSPGGESVTAPNQGSVGAPGDVAKRIVAPTGCLVADLRQRVTG